MTEHTTTIGFYSTQSHPCTYLDELESITLFADPAFPMDSYIYNQLLEQGFRRSGQYVYRPRCENCNKCISTRIDVHHFMPSRQQKRTWKRNQDLVIRAVESGYKEEHYQLYQRYIKDRHPGGGMDQADQEEYQAFFQSSWCNSILYEFRLNKKLLAVSVVDQLPHGLSAVYTFFDPDYGNRSLGGLAILWLTHEARYQRLPWVYLGYWIPDHPKMDYKKSYQPLQVYWQDKWQLIDNNELLLQAKTAKLD